jgi:hypothetical protein
MKKIFFAVFMICILISSAIAFAKNETQTEVMKPKNWWKNPFESLWGAVLNLQKQITELSVNGIAGPQGEKGDTGPQGEQGIPGPKGDTGLQGPQGIQGEQGSRGEKGEKGDTGSIGPQGEKGEIGPQGEPGICPYSADEITQMKLDIEMLKQQIIQNQHDLLYCPTDTYLIGQDCTVGIGACQRTGKYECFATDLLEMPYKRYPRCNVEPGEPQEETCNGIDDDCNGEIDDYVDGNLNTCQQFCTLDEISSCTVDFQGYWSCNGVQRCGLDGWGACILPEEVCNGIDDDCDGIIDEDLIRTCYSGIPGTSGIGICAPGTQICNDAEWGMCIGEILPQAEICDGLDNDCDGEIDEAWDVCGPDAICSDGRCIMI